MVIKKADPKKPTTEGVDTEAGEKLPPQPPVVLTASMIEQFKELKDIEGKKLKNGDLEVSAADFDKAMGKNESIIYLLQLKQQRGVELNEAAAAQKTRKPVKAGKTEPFWGKAGDKDSLSAIAENYKNLLRDNHGGEVDKKTKEMLDKARADLTKAVKAGLKKMGTQVPEGVKAEEMAEMIAFTLKNEAETELGAMLKAQQQIRAAKAAAKAAGTEVAASGDEGDPASLPMKPATRGPRGSGSRGAA